MQHSENVGDAYPGIRPDDQYLSTVYNWSMIAGQRLPSSASNDPRGPSEYG